jgi:hypothetical protein
MTKTCGGMANARSPPRAEMEFDQAAGRGDWPEMDQTAGAVGNVVMIRRLLAPAGEDPPGGPHRGRTAGPGRLEFVVFSKM